MAIQTQSIQATNIRNKLKIDQSSSMVKIIYDKIQLLHQYPPERSLTTEQFDEIENKLFEVIDILFKE